MKILLGAMVAGAVLTLAACEPTVAVADKSEPAGEIVGKCEFPSARRDKYLLAQIAKGNDPQVIAETGAAFESRGANLEESGSFQNYLSIVTGKPNKLGPQQAANFNDCLDQHR